MFVWAELPLYLRKLCWNQTAASVFIVEYGIVTKTYCNKLKVVLAVRGKEIAVSGMLSGNALEAVPRQVRYQGRLPRT